MKTLTTLTLTAPLAALAVLLGAPAGAHADPAPEAGEPTAVVQVSGSPEHDPIDDLLPSDADDPGDDDLPGDGDGDDDGPVRTNPEEPGTPDGEEIPTPTRIDTGLAGDDSTAHPALLAGGVLGAAAAAVGVGRLRQRRTD